jgi:BMFP domain-containing protein YqiC
MNTPTQTPNAMEDQAKDAIRRIHHYGYPADVRLHADVEGDVDDILSPVFARLDAVTRERDALRTAAASAMAAMRDNLSKYQYKNEPALLEAVCQLQEAGIQLHGEPNADATQAATLLRAYGWPLPVTADVVKSDPVFWAEAITYAHRFLRAQAATIAAAPDAATVGVSE